MSEKLFNRLVVVWCSTLTISIFCTVIFFPYGYMNVIRDEVRAVRSTNDILRKDIDTANERIEYLKIKINSLVKQ